MKILAITNMFPTPANPWLGNFVEQQVKGLLEIGIEIDLLSLDRVVEGPGVYIRLRENVRRRLKQSKFDLVHVMYGGVMADLATGILNDIPSVITIHGSDLLGERLADTIHRISAHVGVLASRRAAKRADGVITVSSVLKDALPPYVDRSKVRVIPCGIDLNRFQPQDSESCRQQLGWVPGSYHILFANNGAPVKRPEIARKSVQQLVQRGVKAELHEMSGIPYQQVPTWINAADALVLTSEHEGSPTIVKECLACNVPVVSVDVGDVRERIADIDGCFIASADEDELAARLESACAARSSVNSRERMMELSLPRIAERISGFYEEILASRKVPSRPASV